MTSEDVLQEIEREPYVPLRLHLTSGQRIDVRDPGSAFIRQNTLLLVQRSAPRSQAIGNYDVIAPRLIERIEQLNGSSTTRSKQRRRGK